MSLDGRCGGMDNLGIDETQADDVVYLGMMKPQMEDGGLMK